MKETESVKTYTLTREEVESLLRNKFGGRIQPVDSVMVAHQKQKQQQRQATFEAYKTRFAKPHNNSGPALKADQT